MILRRGREAFQRRFDVTVTFYISAAVLKCINRKEWPKFRIYNLETSWKVFCSQRSLGPSCIERIGWLLPGWCLSIVCLVAKIDYIEQNILFRESDAPQRQHHALMNFTLQGFVGFVHPLPPPFPIEFTPKEMQNKNYK